MGNWFDHDSSAYIFFCSTKPLKLLKLYLSKLSVDLVREKYLWVAVSYLLVHTSGKSLFLNEVVCFRNICNDGVTYQRTSWLSLWCNIFWWSCALMTETFVSQYSYSFSDRQHTELRYTYLYWHANGSRLNLIGQVARSLRLGWHEIVETGSRAASIPWSLRYPRCRKFRWNRKRGTTKLKEIFSLQIRYCAIETRL